MSICTLRWGEQGAMPGRKMMETKHLTPPRLDEHNPRIFIGGDPISWLNTHVGDDDPPAMLAMFLPFYENQVRLVIDHCRDHGGTMKALGGSLRYANGTTCHLFRHDDVMRVRGCRFDHAWVSPSIVDDEEAMLYINLAVRKP